MTIPARFEPFFEPKLNAMKPSKTKHVIDAVNMVSLESFNEEDAEEIKAKYEAMGKWDDVGIDCNGDLILWEDDED